MRGTAVFLAFALSALLFLWTFGSMYFIVIIELMPALDPIGVVRAILFAPGYSAFLLGETLTNLGLSVDPPAAAAILASALSVAACVGLARLFADPS